MIFNTISRKSRFAREASIGALGFALLTTMSGAAFAQDTAADAESGEIVVRGFRESLESSIRAKKAESSIVEAVTAEDIGKLPDVSIAESIARLPGLTAQRVEGRGQKVSIRGLGPEFSTTLINGREQVTTGDNRGAEFDQYPSELFNQVLVYKSPHASLIGQGLAGTVDMRTIKPLSQSERILSLQGRYEYGGQKSLNPDSPRDGYRFSGTYVDKFADDTLGIALGAAYISTPSQNEKWTAWGGGNYPTTAAGDVILGGAKPYVQSNLLNRIGAIGSVEYEPSDSFHLAIDGFYSKFKEKQRLRGIEFPLAWSGATQSGLTASNGFVDKVTFGNVHAIQRNDFNQRDATTYAFGLNGEFAVSDKVKLTIDGSMSHSKRTDFLLETYSGSGYNGAGLGDSVTVTRRPNGLYSFSTTLNYADTNVIRITDPGGWGYNGTTSVVQAGFLNRPSFKDDLKSLRASLSGDIESGALESWEVGANYSARKKTSAFTSYFLCPKGAGTNCTVASGTLTSVPVPSAAVLSQGTGLHYLGLGNQLTLNPLYLYDNVLNPVFDNRPVSLVRDNTVSEDVLTGWAKININGDWGGTPVKGNFGVQFVHTKQSSDGLQSNLSNGVVTNFNVSGSDSYDRVLPSANLSFEVGDNMFIKVAAARSLARARMDQLRVSSELQVRVANLTITDPLNSVFAASGGNIRLKPYIADGFDVSFEKYFGGAGYVSVAAYYKSLSDFVDPTNKYLYDFTAALSLLSPAQRPLAGTTKGYVVAPANTGKGSIKGIEATLSLPFSLISTGLDGFGFIGSGSYTDSKIKFGNGSAVTVPGLSKWVGNATVYFETGGFEARASYRYRSRFLAEISGLSANPDFRSARSEGVLDAQIGYTFKSGALDGLSLLLQAQNLTNQPFVTTNVDNDQLIAEHQTYGRNFLIGATYKF